MTSKEKILENIKLSTVNKNVILDDVEYLYDKKDLSVKFKNALKSVSAEFLIFSNYDETVEIINSYFPNQKRCINTIKEINISGLDLSKINNPTDFHPLDLSIIKGDFAVAENGAIWINTGDLPDRTIPFLCENLIIIIDGHNIVGDMHEAYHKTDGIDYSYGTFITGPSKTADIEQTLVVGAQGPRKMLVLISENSFYKNTNTKQIP